jgi:hypothetical protein
MVTDNNSMLTRQRPSRDSVQTALRAASAKSEDRTESAAALRQGEQQRRQDRENNSNSKVETTVATVRSGILDLVIALVK